MTRLLVSVRNADEALAAINSGSDIIDVKEPHAGSLGCAAPGVISEIAASLRSFNDSPPLSLALGELSEWREQCDELHNAIRSATPQFLKLGLADCRTTWRDDWRQVRNSLPESTTWVAVAYADFRQANAPSVADVLNAAIEAHCGILLLDTCTKDGTSLLDHVSTDDLASIRSSTVQHGILLALAGRVSISNLPEVMAIKPDIIAVRGAVCEGSQRTATVTAKRIQQFRNAMHALKQADRSDQTDLFRRTQKA